MIQTHRDKANHEVWGRCDVCKVVILYGDRWDHAGHMIDTSWNAAVNPDNTQWLPGYRFYSEQMSGARTGRKLRGHTHKVSRTYRVEFEIDREGQLRHVRGPKPTDDLLEGLEALYQRERPGSNWYPGCEDEPPSCGPGLEGL